ncbi:Fibropellin-3 [Stylophora pistillata]|uniref:Fibropellin-3 n=1 Tax=Stylophora pistillata TaxID=50429 RepID=A0A2B4RCU4_STYPI|nr:Fibropellin-3 [Stylophora pistillata]
MKVTPLTWHNSFLFLSLLTAIQTELSQAAFKEDKTSKTTGKSHQHHKTDVKKEKRFMNEHFPKGRVVYSFVTDRNRYLARRPHLYRAFVVRSPLRVQQSTENANGRQNIPFMEVEPTYHQPFVRVRPISRPIYYLQDTPDEQEAEFEDPLNEPVALMPEEFPAAVPIRVIMEDGAGDSDMEDLDVYAIEDMAADYAMEKIRVCQIPVNTMVHAYRLITGEDITAFVKQVGEDMPATVRDDLCYPTNPCLHGGTCFNALDAFICHCPPRYSGKHCGTVGDPCQPNPCENGGTCHTGHGEKLFECTCREGFIGTKCEASKSACVSNPCANGGTCVDATNNDGSLLEGVIFTNHSQFKCVCPKGYAGENCEKLVMTNPCSTHPCLNNGTCFDDTNSAGIDLKLLNALDFRCFCPIGYSGIVCETPKSACHSSPCLHGGTCLDSSNTADVAFNANGYKCLCTAGFIGMNCEDNYIAINFPKATLQATVKPIGAQSYKPTVQVIDVHASRGTPGAPPVMALVPQEPKETSAVSGQLGATLLAKPVSSPAKANVGLTAEFEKPSQSQVGVVVIPQSAQARAARPTTVQSYGPPSSSSSGVAMALSSGAPGQLGYVLPVSSSLLPYVASPSAAPAPSTNSLAYVASKAVPAQLPSVGLISSPPAIPSLLAAPSSSPAVAQAPGIIMPPGLSPLRGNGPLSLALPEGTPVFGLTARRQTLNQRSRNYGPSYASYNGYTSRNANRGNNQQIYGRYPYTRTNCGEPLLPKPMSEWRDMYGVESKCRSNPCRNGGTCFDNHNSYTCSCLAGFSGINCETMVSVCDSNPCLNGGSCLNQGPNIYKCVCAHGFRGKNCESEKKCEPNPCQNSGVCRELIEDEDYKCECLHGYRGKDCEEEINLCESNPCINGGTCSTLGSSYHCLCVEGFRGINCQEELKCHSNPCQNGGTCFENSGGYTCTCQPGYKGINCAERDNCHPNPCHHGGVCDIDGEDFTCSCSSGWTGLTCEAPSTIAYAVANTCAATTYGCCPDGKTPAAGPHQAGCPGAHSN